MADEELIQKNRLGFYTTAEASLQGELGAGSRTEQLAEVTS
jgi:hypothetical protein